MKVKELIAELLKVENQEAEVTLLGNVGHPEDEETDVRFQNLEVWHDGEDSITLFFGLSEETLEQINKQQPTNSGNDDEDYLSGLLYGVDNNQ
jgi:hypothetical protein